MTRSTETVSEPVRCSRWIAAYALGAVAAGIDRDEAVAEILEAAGQEMQVVAEAWDTLSMTPSCHPGARARAQSLLLAAGLRSRAGGGLPAVAE